MIREFRKLHDEVSATPFSDFEPVLAEELGPDWKLYFREIETAAPLGTASLAQVYQATLPDGRRAAVKIQRPGVRSIVYQDMAILRKAARLMARGAPRFNAVIDVEAMLEVVFDAMEPEYDFTAEARNMDQGRRSVERYKHLSVPKVLLATERVLIQSLAAGASIRDVERESFSTAERMAIGRDLLAYLYCGFFIDQYFHADPHPGNIFVQPGKKASLIDWGMVGRVDRRTSMCMVLILLALAQNDGHGLAKGWIEMGRATPWADIAQFTSDMARLVPKIVGASLEELDFGITLTAVLEYATKRGIQTSPSVAILGKAFGNMEGSIRYLAPELSLVEVFQDELRAIMFDLTRPLLSKEQAARNVMEIIIGATAATDQLRSVLRDLSNREFRLLQQSGKVSRAERASQRTDRILLGLAVAALWLEHRRGCRR
ncbi:MAG: AarF/ABC1/UbiB kinase family protein [Actinomycetota bacterium]|nr:AarF/ABC1/UbiB kinase family protein [Actinomycetota bacterium]